MANKYWVGGSGNWSNPNHWSNWSGGEPGASIPEAGDYVYFTEESYPNENAFTIYVDVNVNCYSLSFTNNSSNAKSTIDFSDRTIIVEKYISFQHEHFKLKNTNIVIGDEDLQGSSILSFSNIGNATYDTRNLSINVIASSSYYQYSNILFSNNLVIPNLYITYSYINRFTKHTLSLLIDEEDTNVNIQNISNNFPLDMSEKITTYVEIGNEDGSLFTFDNFNLNGSIINNFTIYLSSDSWDEDEEVTIYKESGIVNVENLWIEDVSVSGGATWTNSYSIQLKPKGKSTGWIYYSPLYWIGGSGDLMDPQNWSFTSGGPPANLPPFRYFDNWYYEYLYAPCDLIFDENSFSENNSLILFNTTEDDDNLPYFDWWGIEFFCKSINTVNATKNFTIQYTSEISEHNCAIHVVDVQLSDKITIQGDMKDPKDYSTINYMKLSINHDLNQNNAKLGPYFMLTVYHIEDYNYREEITCDIQLQSNLTLEEYSVIYLSILPTCGSLMPASFNSNGYQIKSPCMIFNVAPTIAC